MVRHYLKAEYDDEDKLTRFCGRCGEYLTHEDHFRDGEHPVTQAEMDELHKD